MFENALLLIFPAAMIFAAVMDLFTMTIPNRVSLVLVAGFAIVAPFSGMPLGDIAIHVALGLGVLAVTIGMFSLNLLGGGDAKLLAAASLWVGIDLMFPFTAYVGIFGGLLAVVILAYRKFVPEFLVIGREWTARLHKQGGGIPYGVAIAAAAVAVYPKTQWFAGLVAAGL